MTKLEEIRRRDRNSLESPTVPGDLETAQRTESILRVDRAFLLSHIAKLEVIKEAARKLEDELSNSGDGMWSALYALQATLAALDGEG